MLLFHSYLLTELSRRAVSNRQDAESPTISEELLLVLEVFEWLVPVAMILIPFPGEDDSALDDDDEDG